MVNLAMSLRSKGSAMSLFYQIEAIAAIADYIAQKDVIDKNEIKDIDNRLNNILASIDTNNRFFKRLL